MPKLAIKTKKKILEKDVFLKRSYDGYMQYGKLELIDKREGHTNVIGKISNNLLQEDLIIEYDDEFEKFKIIECIPSEFYYRVNMDQMKIFISFTQEPIKAHLFTNREYVDGFYKFLTCFDEEEDVILKVTLKSPDLSRRILDFKKKVLEVKKEFYPKRFLKYEDAIKDVKSYLIYLMENYQVEVLEDNYNEYLANLRKYYNNSDIEMFADLLRQGQDGFSFMFRFEEKVYKVTIGSKKTDRYFEDFGEFVQYYNEHIKNQIEGE